MRRLIFNLFLIFTIHEIFSTVAATQYESCPLIRQMEEQCQSYTYTVVRPMLDYFKQVSDDLQQSHAKDKLIRDLSKNSHAKDETIRDLREKLVRQEGNEALIKQLHVQIDFQTQTILKLIENLKPSEIYDKCNEKLAQESKKLQICEFQLNKINSSLIEKDEIILRASRKIQQDSEDQKAVELKLKQSQAELLNKGKDQELCQSEVDKLNRTAQNIIPSSCIPFGEYPGIHQIKVSEVGFIDVLCDSQLAGPGWLVMQQRIGGDENFNRNWTSYREGFGSLESDFFLGLETIHRLTNSRRYELYIHLVAVNGTTYYARYDDFKISDEDNGYALSLGQFEGNDEDAMREVDRRKFTTFDRDNDTFSGNCALYYKSGWWYKNCSNCNLNGIYGEYLYWYQHGRLQKAKMLIRPKD